MDGTVDLALVPAFVEVVRQGSFTRAAKALKTPKSTISRRVARLEAQLGVPLLVRTTRRLRLTDQGELFYGRVAAALEGVEEAARAVAEAREEPRGLLRISIPPDFGQLPDRVTSFLAAHPSVTVEIEATGRYVDLVGERFDVAVRAGRLEDSSLVARTLGTVEFHLFAADAYLERRGEPERVEELASHDCVLLGRMREAARWALHGPSGPEPVDVRGRLAASDLVFVRGAVIAGAGIGLLPSDAFAPAHAGVRRVLPEHCMPGGAIHVVYPGTRHLPAKVRAFRDHLLATGRTR